MVDRSMLIPNHLGSSTPSNPARCGSTKNSCARSTKGKAQFQCEIAAIARVAQTRRCLGGMWMGSSQLLEP